MTTKNVDNQRYFLITAVILVCGVLFYLLRAVLLPFVMGIVIAYFLDPLVSKISKGRISRTVATVIVMFILLLVLLPLLVLSGGAVVSQVADFADKLPYYSSVFAKRVMPIVQSAKEHFPNLSLNNMEDVLQQNALNSVKVALRIIGEILANGFAFINLISLLLISPIVAFYMLRDWHIFTEKFIGLIPQKNKKNLINGLTEINKIISGYLRGQFLVCLSLGTYYSLGLWAVNLELGVMVGFIAGLISFIPYVGSISGFLMAMALVVTQYGTLGKIMSVVAVFAVGQFLEGNFLTPKLVGENIGLHPVWVMFALLAGGTLLGLLGMLIAVPSAAIIGVLLRYIIRNYKESQLYLAKR